MDPMKKIQIPPDIERLAAIAVDAAFAVHHELGPGLLESAYQECLAYEFRLRGLEFRKELPVPFRYQGQSIEVGFRADFLLGQRLLLELKAAETLLPIHKAQVITYLRVLELPLGLLINFNEVLIKDGIHRIPNLKNMSNLEET
jgi:GxxExxY protein